MKKDILLFGAIFVLLICVAALVQHPQNLLDECKKELRQGQKCVFTAVPEGKANEKS